VAAFFETLRALDVRRFEPKRILADDTMAAAVIHVEIAVRATRRVINDLERTCGSSTHKARSRASATSRTPTSTGWRCGEGRSSLPANDD
jgi:hypothetical protein